MTDTAVTSAMSPETPLEPELEILDPHHHLLEKKGVHAYLLDEFKADTSSHKVVESIFVECAWPALDSISEVRKAFEWSRDSATTSGTKITGVIGFADLRQGAAVGELLDEMSSIAESGGGSGLFKGIRHGATWDASPEIRNHRTGPSADLYEERAFREGFAQLARRHLTFDAWVYHPKLPTVASLADEFPDTRIILDHLGGPLAAGRFAGHADQVDEHWKHGMKLVAERQNVFLKIGGIGFDLMVDSTVVPLRPSSKQLADHWRSRILWAIEVFGTDRCMFESNFPADRGVCDYLTIWNAFKLITGDFSDAEKADLFRLSARKAYYGIA
ncbi:amidohydrolase family protein [Paraburkholderia fynbosensis]|uniref:Amidohydrolase-related domain-containing protein n=1 Tax=Paraburkholderia fynbosensis TaxID=1200993 RepID=A0A6J5H1T4_9BURK|nr:amidohydrolase family protein [Paraburkholderia fynbosensis]CAB3809700.1 hypothetical protein LMG27177_06880 [Paraburkholderia fynbosensis]